MKRTRFEMSRPMRARKKFLRYFPGGFRDETYIDWERGYKWNAHQQWMAALGPTEFKSLLKKGRFAEIAAHAVRIESRTNLLFSFEKMALRDAVKSAAGARAFATGLSEFLHGAGDAEEKFAAWCETVAALPRRQTRVLTWPLVTVWGIHRGPRAPFFPETKRHPDRGARLRFRFSLSIETELGHLFGLARVCRNNPAGSARSATARYDRPSVVRLGARLERVSGLGRRIRIIETTGPNISAVLLRGANQTLALNHH